MSGLDLVGRRLGKCTDCGHPCTVYAWKGSLPLKRAVCPIHRTPLERTTTPKDMRRIVLLEMSPTKDGGGLARRLADKAWRPLREVLADGAS